MTIVAAIKDGNAIIVVADAAASDGNEFSIRRGNPKTWNVIIPGLGEAILGFAGTFSICQHMRYFSPPPFLHLSLQEYLARSFQHELRIFLKKEREHYEIKEIDEWTLLFAAQSQIFILYPNGDVEENIEDFSAIGDGAHVAIGAIGALKETEYVSWENSKLCFKL